MRSVAALLLLVPLVVGNVIDIRVASDSQLPGRLHAKGPVYATCDNEPAPHGCKWMGTSPFCAGSCAGQTYKRWPCGSSGCGDGVTCLTGLKQLCCENGVCNNAQKELAGTRGYIPPDPSQLEDYVPSDDVHARDDEYCGKGKHTMCPPGATKNEECICVPDVIDPTEDQHVLEM